MYELRFSLCSRQTRVFPLGQECFYIVGSYIVKHQGFDGEANFQTWINDAGNGVGLMTIDIPKCGLFFIQTFDSFKNRILQRKFIGVAGGLLDNPRRQVVLEYGSFYFKTPPSKKNSTNQDLNCLLRGKILDSERPGSIPFYQNYVLTDAEITVNEIQPGDPDSTYRVGQLEIRDSVSNSLIGKNFFENFVSSGTNRGIGLSTYITENQILFTILSLEYSSSIQDPSSTVKIRAIIPAGQKYVKGLIQAIDQTTVNASNYMETITGISRNITGNELTVIDCILTNLKVQIFRLQPDEPKSVVRLGYYTIINNLVDKKEIGSVNFQSFVTTEQLAIGTVVIQLKGQEGCLFGSYTTEFDSPVVIEPNFAQVGLTSGNGAFAGLYNGYADLETIPFSTDRKARISFALEKKK